MVAVVIVAVVMRGSEKVVIPPLSPPTPPEFWI